jgi:subtilisin family serine protease
MRSLFSLAALSFAFAAPTQNKPAGLQVVDKYIVVLKPASDFKALNLGKRGSIFETLEAIHSWHLGSFKGFSATLTGDQLTELRADSKVAYVEADGILYTQDQHMKRDGTSGGRIQSTQKGSTWGLGRISHRSKSEADYVYDSTAGAGTCTYVIDTGLYAKHPDFEGRATFVKNFDKLDGTDDDLHGHGTHVGGTIGSKTYGVAKKTQIFGLKTCNQYGSCQLSDVNAAILEAVSDSAKRTCPNGVVINISLAAVNEQWQSIADAIAQATKAGVFVAVASGNAGANAADYSPASSPGVCSVGASSNTDAIASFSNYGSTVSIVAPGVDILSLATSGSGTVSSSQIISRFIPRTNYLL